MVFNSSVARQPRSSRTAGELKSRHECVEDSTITNEDYHTVGGFKFPNDIEGLSSKTEGELLYRLAQINPRLGKVVELGAYHGRSTVCLAQGSRKVEGGKVFTVDNFTGDKLVGIKPDFYLQFKRNIKRWKLEKQITALRGDTTKIAKKWQKPIRLLFIDADHFYQAVKEDFNAWEKHIAPGGIVAFHDVLCWWGVYHFVIETMLFSNFKDFKTLKKDTMGITYAIKKSKNQKISQLDRGKTLTIFLLTTVYRFPALVRIYFSQKDESDFWYQFFDRLAKLYRKIESQIRKIRAL